MRDPQLRHGREAVVPEGEIRATERGFRKEAALFFMPAFLGKAGYSIRW